MYMLTNHLNMLFPDYAIFNKLIIFLNKTNIITITLYWKISKNLCKFLIYVVAFSNILKLSHTHLWSWARDLSPTQMMAALDASPANSALMCLQILEWMAPHRPLSLLQATITCCGLSSKALTSAFGDKEY